MANTCRAASHQCLLVGHRHFGFRDARVECDRYILPEGVFRRTLVRGFTLDEAVVNRALGRGTDDAGRGKLLVLLEGRMLATAFGRPHTLTAGDLIGVSALDQLVCHGGDALTLTIDWPANGSFDGHGRLASSALDTMAAAAAALYEAKPPTEHLSRAVLAAGSVLAAEGIALEGFAERIVASTIDGTDQAYLAQLERVLSRLDDVPAATDWDGTRRTLTRRTHAFHRRYRLFGVRRGTDWRAIRDFHRLVTAAALVTHPQARVSEVAQAVGYRSPASLCAAFAQVGLPSPAKVRALSIAA